MFIGGPVKRDAALCLAVLRVGAEPDGVTGRELAGRMVMVDLDADPESIAPVVEGVRIFAGYSGWTIGHWKARSSATTGLCCRRYPLTFGRAAGRPVGAGAATSAPAAVDAGHPPDRRQPRPIGRDGGQFVADSLLAITEHTTSWIW